MQGFQAERGVQGYSGIQGTAGDGQKGLQGFDGPQGYRGLQGFSAERGAQGYLGGQGMEGRKGSQGYGGQQGVAGSRGAQGYDGSQGSDGSQGLRGPQGYAGQQGYRGLQGRDGSQGVDGPQGLSGLMGDQGEDGPQGVVGCQGRKGDQGYRGLQGFRGEQGDVGFKGMQAAANGEQGYKGVQGFDGQQGHDGTQGLMGKQGFVAERGAQGYLGGQGVDGQQGLNGQQGVDGMRGVQGFDGLQGLHGRQGVDGARGTQGYNGSQGYDGRQGFAGQQGYDGQQGVVGSRGAQGYDGAQGGDGMQGLRGRQGSAGQQGYRGLQGYDGQQGVAGSRGVQGYNGSQGVDGSQGLSGLMGDQGKDGPQGIVGCQGRKGDQGYRGLQGFRGEQGEVGFKGMQAAANGNQGYRGVQGYDGAQGYRGTQGYNGVQGYRGEQGYRGDQGPTGAEGVLTKDDLTGVIANLNGSVVFETSQSLPKELFSDKRVNKVYYNGAEIAQTADSPMGGWQYLLTLLRDQSEPIVTDGKFFRSGCDKLLLAGKDLLSNPVTISFRDNSGVSLYTFTWQAANDESKCYWCFETLFTCSLSNLVDKKFLANAVQAFRVDCCNVASLRNVNTTDVRVRFLNNFIALISTAVVDSSAFTAQDFATALNGNGSLTGYNFYATDSLTLCVEYDAASLLTINTIEITQNGNVLGSTKLCPAPQKEQCLRRFQCLFCCSFSDLMCESIVQAEVACDEKFCAPKNPYVFSCDLDPCGAFETCRAVARPLGTHLPCATLQVDSVSLMDAFDAGFGNPTTKFVVATGCANPNGCEFMLFVRNSASDSAILYMHAFVVDQNCKVLNADGTAYTATISTNVNKSFVALPNNANFYGDSLCLKGERYVLYRNSTPKYSVQKFPDVAGLNAGDLPTTSTPPGTPFNTLEYTVLTSDAKRNRLLVGSRGGDIFEIPLKTFVLNTAPITVIANTYIGDMKVVGDLLFVVGTTNVASDDVYVTVDLTDPNYSRTTVTATGRRSFELADIQPGIAIHPAAPVVYVAQTASDNCSHYITCIKLDPSDHTSLSPANVMISEPNVQATVQTIDVTENASASLLQRLRPNYQDGVLQYVLPGVGQIQWTTLFNFDSNMVGSIISGTNQSATWILDNICGPVVVTLNFTFDSIVGSANQASISVDTSLVETITLPAPDTVTYVKQYNIACGLHSVRFTLQNTSEPNFQATVTTNGIFLNDVNIVGDAAAGVSDNVVCERSSLITYCVDDDNPCALSLVRNESLPTLIPGAGLYPQLAQGPSGCLMFASTNMLQLHKPADCEQRYLNKKPLLTQNPQDHCKTVIKKAEQACDASFCAPDNPFITVFDQNCDPGKDCRAVARPAGTHFPCATFQVQSTAAFDQTNIIVDNVPDDVNVFALKYNPYGCEFVATWFVVGETVGKLIRFVVDQDCQLRNATTGVIASTPVDLGAVATVTGTPSGTNESIQHVICHDGVTYVASSRALTIDPFGLNNSIGLASTPLAVAVQSTNGHYAYVAVRAVDSIRVVNLSDNSTTAFNLSTGGNASGRAVDALVCGNVLIVALINYGAGPNDAVALYDFSSNPLNPVLLSTLVLSGQNSGNNSTTGQTIWPGLVHHPTKQIIYVTGRKSNSAASDELYLNAVGYNNLTLVKQKTLTFTADPLTTQVTQKALRPVYRDSVLQMVYPQSSSCALSTIRVNDNNPLDIETVSTVSLTPSPSFNSCYERFASLSSGALILIAYQELGVFKPAASALRYVNDKPMHLSNEIVFASSPNTLSLLFYQPSLSSFGPVSDTNQVTWQLGLNTALSWSFFSENGIGTVVSNNVNIFTATRFALFEITVKFAIKDQGTNPPAAGYIMDVACLNQNLAAVTERLYAYAVTYSYISGTTVQWNVHAQQIIALGPTRPLTLTLRITPGGAPVARQLQVERSYLSLRYLRNL